MQWSLTRLLLQIVDVLEIKESTPLLIVLYMSVTDANPLPGLRWIQDLSTRERFSIANISANDLEQKLMLKILDLNSKFLPVDFAPTRRPSEKEFKISFLLPMGPLNFDDLGKLNLDTGCVVCGKKIASRCSQCLSVSYCGVGESPCRCGEFSHADRLACDRLSKVELVSAQECMSFATRR